MDGIGEVSGLRARAGRLRPDTGLIVRMVLALALLGVVYALFLLVLYDLGVSYVLLVVIGGGLLMVQFFYSDRLVLMSMGARVVNERQAPDLHAIVAKVAQLADLPKPQVAISPSGVPNAFATGRSPKHAVVCVTRGILDRLDDEELEAVLAHEITHVKNRDMMVITFVSFFATAASLIFQNGFFMMGFGGFGGGFGGGRGRRDANSMAIVWIVSLLVWLVSFFLIRAISRYREYAADRGSGILTGRPSELMSALVKISDTNRRIPDRDLRQVEGLSAFFIVPALSRGSVQELLSTHPSLEHRLARLRTLESQLR